MAARPDLELVIKAINEAKGVLQEAGQDVKRYADTVMQENRKTQASMKDIATSISGVVTAGFAMYSMYESVERQQLMVHRMTNSLEDAQRRQKSTLEKLNEAIADHGENSEDAVKAQEVYDAACKDVELAQERLTYAQNNLNEAIIRTATFAIPSLVTFLDRGKESFIGLKGAIDASHLSLKSFMATAGIIGMITVGIIGTEQASKDLVETTKELVRQGQLTEYQAEEFLKTMHIYIDLSSEVVTASENIGSSFGVLHSKIYESAKGIEAATIKGSDAFQEMMNSVMLANRQIENSTKEMTLTVSEMIREGLLEDAQGAIQEYVECAGGKHAKMIEDVKGDLAGLESKEKENANKIKLATIPNLDEMAAEWERYGELNKSVIGMTAGEIQELEGLFAENEDWLIDFVDLTEEEKQKEVDYWTTSNNEIKKKIDQLKAWLKELEEAYLAVAAAREEAGIEGGGGGGSKGEEGTTTSYAKEYATLKGLELTPIPKGTYILEHHSPAMAVPIEDIRPKGARTIPSEAEVRAGMRERWAEIYQPVYVAPRTEVNINITGPVQPAVISTLARETKKAAYEGVSEALRDELRRKGIPIWTGE